MESYTCLTISVSTAEQSDELVSYLDQMGFEGFEQLPDQLKAYRPVGEWPEKLVHDHLREKSFPFTTEQIEKTNWNQLWESYFDPVQIDDWVGIRAAFHPPLPQVKNELVITPKMSFGTGHHATTRLMMQQMRTSIQPGDRVLDFGTGTGVLAILSKKMGAAEVVGIDIEDWSIENARENAAVNHVTDIHFLVGDRISVAGPFDRILANINRNILIEHMHALRSSLSPSGTLLLSGILEADLPVMDEALCAAQLSRTHHWAQGGWICIQAAHIQGGR
ncbi:MAG: 50S ribosomal protein L11 methyltransferase [Bacteroidetes bacterium]|nr:50S ribosomal protein L11 methyltransferase [Bacteroidota bacterium]